MAYMDNNFMASDEFLKTYEWRKLRQVVIEKYGNKCMCCGAVPTNGVYLCVDHIMPRKKYPELALSVTNLQILCNACNHGKGNWSTKDWRSNADFIITEAWLRKHTKGGNGISRSKAEAIGMTYPPKSGWFKSLLGLCITDEQREMFEKGVTRKQMVALENKEREQMKGFVDNKTDEVAALKKQVAQLTSMIGQLNKTMKGKKS